MRILKLRVSHEFAVISQEILQIIDEWTVEVECSIALIGDLLTLVDLLLIGKRTVGQRLF